MLLDFRVEWVDKRGREHRTKVLANSSNEALQWVMDNRVTCARILTAYRKCDAGVSNSETPKQKILDF